MAALGVCRYLQRTPILSQVRKFGVTSVARAQELVKPPIHLFGIDGRYAHAVYSAAAKQKHLDKVEEELNNVDKMIKGSEKLSEFLMNPTTNKRQKQAALEELLKAQKMSDLTINLLTTMAENNRLKLISSVANSYGKLMSATRGEVLCTVTTAKELDNANSKELQAALKMFLKKGETLKLETLVDPSLIGGMVVSFGDKHIDMSIAKKVKDITNVMKESL
ncbi:ATP synthase subunit O, mitochondrial-like [Actinia tenebrosa]|uniref:Oligomycin sensitivity conferral protein n=1 Tax=Actinia tenebrosa TaxID=6105 RepID=A0A6P8IVB4_ACTTE|nr:ATP synthase subunit O, mitochondrial-like [Actinia tenebrosa]